jgi:hypothetical protein
MLLNKLKPTNKIHRYNSHINNSIQKNPYCNKPQTEQDEIEKNSYCNKPQTEQDEIERRRKRNTREFEDNLNNQILYN